MSGRFILMPALSITQPTQRPARTRVQRRAVHGVLLLDKPLGLSSNQALQKAKWLLRAEKAGHTGTLDPLASGVLSLCFRAPTKFSQQHLDADKVYETTVRLGLKTRTADAEGEVIAQLAVQCTLGQVVEVLDQFTGSIRQVPPMHSALKKDGKALYEYAREGETVAREPRDVVIHDLALVHAQLDGDEPHLRLRVHCSKGTYIRTLAEDMASAVGSLAHLVALRRTWVGEVPVVGCKTLVQLVGESTAMNPEPSTIADTSLMQAALLHPADFLVQNLIRLDVTDKQAVLCRHGNPFQVDAGQTFTEGAQVRFYLQGRFIGVGQVVASGKDQKIQPVRLVSTENS